ncbi:AAA domain-containing protein [Phyllosticta capitalensis]|uniref:AAA domain-containing protein n=1 Tax=Phyllosticta capitalensis TaxID=121624 RepID=A0ABR1YR09_9PEZI
MLNDCYRMHPHIMKFPSEEFYKGKLVCKADIDHELENSIRTITKRIGDSFFNPMQHRIAVDVSSTLDQSRIVGSELFENTTSSFNETEAEAVVETIKALLAFVPTSVDTTVTDVKLLPERIINPEEILVITPYTGQRRLLNLMIYSQIPEARGKIAVMTTATVHSRENKIVLLSFVTNKPQDPSNVFFIARPKPLNVAITRAQEYLIMFGNFGGWWRDIKEFGLLNMSLFRQRQLVDVEDWCKALQGETTTTSLFQLRTWITGSDMNQVSARGGHHAAGRGRGTGHHRGSAGHQGGGHHAAGRGRGMGHYPGSAGGGSRGYRGGNRSRGNRGAHGRGGFGTPC